VETIRVKVELDVPVSLQTERMSIQELLQMFLMGEAHRRTKDRVDRKAMSLLRAAHRDELRSLRSKCYAEEEALDSAMELARQKLSGPRVV
jgi:hypothetical protein